MWWGILTNQILDVSLGLCGWSPQVSADLRMSPWVSVGGGDINQSKSVPMMSLNVVGNIDQSNFRCLGRSPQVSVGGLCGSLQVVSLGVHGWSPQVSAGGLSRFLRVSMGGLHRLYLCVSLGGLHGSPWVSTGGLHRWSQRVVSVGLRGWWGY